MNVEVHGCAYCEATKHTHGYDGRVSLHEIRSLIFASLTWEYEDICVTEYEWYVIYKGKGHSFYTHNSFQQFLTNVLAEEGELLCNG